ncbi:hypothetical protein [Haloarchaeobius sp. HME9146]|uniref:hypothetical protein n=1 Tax=Haloarchaeobius sp. HME9146 TaxID=2978732 RepID=UPI0021BE6D9E|nr:hypothetical protein [Haloarchaeobius sp. HME9146]MCT9095486.1 hypothetical protein [Haloarchaeobius sp. HME9146]
MAGAGTGLGTTAFFRDSEAIEGWYQSGRVDLLLDYRSTYKPWDRYELKREVPPALVAGTSKTYEIAAAPAIRSVATGEAPSHEMWGNLVTGSTDVFADVCELPDARDISALLPDDFETEQSGTAEAPGVYHPGFIDGPRGMFIDLVDVKPYDEGETTFSVHVCGNPAFVFAELVREDSNGDPLPRSEEKKRIEPEKAAGDLTDLLGELCDYLYVVVSTDPDCDNLATDADDDGDTNPFGLATEDGDILYAGSMSGWLEQFGPTGDGRVVIPPVSPVTEDETPKQWCFTPGVHCYVMNWFLPCKEFDEPGRLGFTDLPIKNVLVEGNPVTDQDGRLGLTFNDELRQRGYMDIVDGLDVTKSVNVTQTDSCHVGIRFLAEQCRHNMDWSEDPDTGEIGQEPEGTTDSEEDWEGTTTTQEPTTDSGTTTEQGTTTTESGTTTTEQGTTTTDSGTTTTTDSGTTTTESGTTTTEQGTTTTDSGTTTTESGTTTTEPGTTTTESGTTTTEQGTTTTESGTTTTESGTTTTESGTTTTDAGTTTTTTDAGTTTTTTDAGTTTTTTDAGTTTTTADAGTTTADPGTSTGGKTTGGTSTGGKTTGSGTGGTGTTTTGTTSGTTAVTTTASGSGTGTGTTGAGAAASGGTPGTNPLNYAATQLSSPAGMLMGGLAALAAAAVGLWRRFADEE